MVRGNKKSASRAPVLAAVDVGSNSIKLTVARRARGRIDVLADATETVRLGSGIESSGSLAPDRIDAAIATLARFAEAARTHGAARLVGVATEATRAASNGAPFLERARIETGWDLRAISGEEEADLTLRGLGLPRDDGANVLVADLGGSSTELIAAAAGTVVWSRSIPLGSGRLTDRLIAHDPPAAAEIAACAEAATGQLAAIQFPAPTPNRLILLGGTAEALARMVPDPANLTGADLEGASARLSAEPAAQVAAAFGVPEARARVLPAGVAIIREMVERLRPGSIRLAVSGIRAGLILAALDELERADADPCVTIRKQIGKLWDDVWEAMPVALAGEDPEGVHKMRVASRQLRAAMAIATPCFPGGWFRRLRRTAREITRSAGAVRDRDVLLAFLKAERARKVTPPMRTAIDDWWDHLSVEREAAREEMLACLAGLEPRKLPAETSRRFSASRPKRKQIRRTGKATKSAIDPTRPWAENARRVLRPRIRSFFASAEAIADPDAVEGQHEARIAAKQLRYTLEGFVDVYGLAGERAIESLKEIQDALGRIHDADVRIALIQSRVESLVRCGEVDPDLLDGYEQLAGRFRRARRRRHAALARDWSRQSATLERQLHSLTR